MPASAQIQENLQRLHEAGPLELMAGQLKNSLGVFTLAEMVLAAILVAVAFARPRTGSAVFAWAERRLGWLAHHRARQILAVGLLAVALRAIMLFWLGVPEPAVFDETSIVLQGQTLALGRLANPPHAFWQHFETFYVNQLPAYASMYFPGRGAPLALGLLIADNAWIGVWMTMVLMCMAATWMLQGWVVLPMALLGGVLVTLRLAVFSGWINTYYGGAFTALGAMLVVGAMPRILREPRWRHGVLMGLGVFILMITRPYEGMLLCIPVGVAMLIRLMQGRWHGAGATLGRVALPVMLMVGAGGALLLQYNQATTGDRFKAAYELNRQTYASAPAFLISPPLKSLNQGPEYFRNYFEVEGSKYRYRESPVLWLRSALPKVFYTWNFYIGAILSVAFFAGVWSVRRNYFLWGTPVFFFAGYFLETWNFPQYTAPLFPLLLILTMRGFQWLRSRDRATLPAALFLARAMPAATLAMLALPVASLVTGKHFLESNAVQTTCCTLEIDKLRPRVRDQLLKTPGRDLVLVKDGPHNPTGYEMVHNEPDIDHAEIVWAHRLDAVKDAQLQAYFADRRVWEFEWLAPSGNVGDDDRPQEVPYRFEPLPLAAAK
ncbi:MAG: putative rane protein [Polaromonas sp.]|nr:putative rane protein [Polaromonas sp.]